MNTSAISSRHCLSFLASLVAISTCHGEEAKRPAGPPKVRVIVKENNLATTAGGTGAASPTPAAGRAAPAKPGGQQQQQQGKGAGQNPQAMQAGDAEKYTRTTKKSLGIAVVDLTPAPMDVTVKTTFFAKDEGGKHETVVETTQEKKLTIQPGKAEEFTTEPVSFTHTAAHRDPPPKGSGGSGGKGGGKSAPAPMIPASGHAYFGYKVEVMQGSDLVGTAASENH
jgi:hypothetical protein